MDKFKLKILKMHVNGDKSMDISQIESFAVYFNDTWRVNNYNSTPSKLLKRFMKSIPEDYSSDAIRHLRRGLRYTNG